MSLKGMYQFECVPDALLSTFSLATLYLEVSHLRPLLSTGFHVSVTAFVFFVV
jgi:hypothetical protein